MDLDISDVAESDLDHLVRFCEFPAMRDNPLTLVMFPNSNDMSKEEEMQWSIDCLKESLSSGNVYFRKVCIHDGHPMGFAIWSLDARTAKETDDKPTKSDAARDRTNSGHKQRDHPYPGSLDVRAWRNVSKLLRDERERVLHGYNNIWRLNLISVDPLYQRRGAGTTLIKWGCEEADVHSYGTFVMASPSAVLFYQRFGFRAMGTVYTHHGVFTSMFRETMRK